MKNRIREIYERAKVVRAEDYVGEDSFRHEQAVREGFLSKARRYLKLLPMATEVVAMYYCMLDARTPLWVKTTVAAALAYFILPADAIPDFLPVVGLGDDVGVLTAALTAVSAHVTDEHRGRAQRWIDQSEKSREKSAKSGGKGPSGEKGGRDKRNGEKGGKSGEKGNERGGKSEY